MSTSVRTKTKTTALRGKTTTIHRDSKRKGGLRHDTSVRYEFANFSVELPLRSSQPCTHASVSTVAQGASYSITEQAQVDGRAVYFNLRIFPAPRLKKLSPSARTAKKSTEATTRKGSSRRSRRATLSGSEQCTASHSKLSRMDLDTLLLQQRGERLLSEILLKSKR